MGTPQNSVSVSRRPPDVEDYIDMLRRYRSWIVAPMFAGLVVSVVVAFLWPNTYRSYAVLRITPQQVPATLVPSVITTQMTQRLEAMETEILSRSTLQEIIQKPALDLYKKERARLPIEDIVQNMKSKAINIIPYTDISTGPGGQRYTTALQIQFSYIDKYKAQAVVTELVSRFTAQNIRVRNNQASMTTTFLNDEVKEAKDKMDKLDAEITKFKAENQGRLPEQFQSNMQALNTLEMTLSSVNDALNRDQSEKMILESQLASLKQQEQAAAAGLEVTIAGQSVRNEHLIDLNRQITELKSNLASAKKIYKPGYPDIKLLETRLDTIQKERDDIEKQLTQQQANTVTTPQKVVNPQVQAQIETFVAQESNTAALIKAKQQDIEHKTTQQDELNRRIAAYQARIEASPEKEQQYAGLLRDYQIAKAQYEDMIRKQQASATAEDLEQHGAGESLEVLDPANLPDSPVEPNRPAIAGIGTAVGMVLGIVLAGAKEMKNTSLKNLKDVRAYTNLPVLSSIPLLENALLVRRKRRLFWLAWSSAVIMGCIAMSGSMYYYYFGSS